MKDRMSFLCELYQLAKYIHEHPYPELDVVTSVVVGLIAGAVAGFPSLTPTTLGKRRRTESDTDTGRTRTAPQMQDAELEASGFVPVQDACCDELNLRDHVRSFACQLHRKLIDPCFSFQATSTLCDELDKKRFSS